MVFDEHHLDTSNEQLNEIIELEDRSRSLSKRMVAMGNELSELLKAMNIYMVTYFSDIPKLEPEKLR